jgi:hypothetical protein
LRLAAGLLLMLPILPTAYVPPRFLRVHFLTALGLLVVAGLFLHGDGNTMFWVLFGVGGSCCLIGSIVWHLEDHPGGAALNWLTPLLLTACMIQGGRLQRGEKDTPLLIGDDVGSALVLGSATTSMLMGHSYLISPSMSIAPLMRLLAALAGSVALRIGLAGVGLWWWSSSRGGSDVETELLLWLPVRWILGLLAPLVLGWMAWETARIRSTQSATGILYVVVIVCFLGELTSQLLLEKTHFIL